MPIMRCKGCKPHEFQDTKYGHEMRVHNVAPRANGVVHVCTVCGHDHKPEIVKKKSKDEDDGKKGKGKKKGK